MFHAAFFALAITGQLTVNDCSFVRAVEEFVIDTVPAPKRMAAVVPETIRAQILLMGDPCYRCRDRAKDELRKMGPDITPYLFWGMHSRDPEIALRCRNLVREFGDCKRCDGTGICWRFQESATSAFHCDNCGAWENDHINDPSSLRQCRACKGLGSCFSRNRPACETLDLDCP
jgi:hypothetical protein